MRREEPNTPPALPLVANRPRPFTRPKLLREVPARFETHPVSRSVARTGGNTGTGVSSKCATQHELAAPRPGEWHRKSGGESLCVKVVGQVSRFGWCSVLAKTSWVEPVLPVREREPPRVCLCWGSKSSCRCQIPRRDSRVSGASSSSSGSSSGSTSGSSGASASAGRDWRFDSGLLPPPPPVSAAGEL